MIGLLLQNKQYNVNAETYPHIEKMLAGVPFDMMVTLTDNANAWHFKQDRYNRRQTCVWSEKSP